MLAVAGETAIDVTALVAALNSAVPVAPLKEADIVTVPGATAVASPPSVMVAIAGFELAHLDDETSVTAPLL
jgi:hypothetical protein